MKNSFTYILIGLLGISIIGNAVLYNRVTDLNDEILDLNDTIFNTNMELQSLQNTISASGCVGDGFTPAKIPLSLADLRKYSDEFKGVSKATIDTISGGIISLEAIKAMSCIQSCNAIAYTFGRNVTDSDFGPKNRGLFIMLRGVNLTFDATKNDYIVNNLNSAVYYGGYWCPTHCLPFN